MIWLLFLFIGCIQLVTWVLRSFVLPGIRAVGEGGRNTAADVVETSTELYRLTILPLIKLCIFLYRLPATVTAWRSGGPSSQGQRAHAQGSSFRQNAGGHRGGSSQQRQNGGYQAQDDEDDYEDTYHWRKGQRGQQGGSQGRQEERKDERSCYDILGVPPGTDLETAKRAYREKCKEYHPDKVSHLGPKLRELAEQELKAINEAWRQFQILHKMFH